LTWGIALWLVAQVAVMPMMRAGFFSGGMMPAMASLVGHIAHGAILGTITGSLQPRKGLKPRAREFAGDFPDGNNLRPWPSRRKCRERQLHMDVVANSSAACG
jgi:hypothetical protein